MRLIYLFTIFVITCQFSNAQTHKIAFKTDYGIFKVLLYDFTPKHRDLMLRSIEDSTYQGALFNRIIENFVVQGGEHDVDIERREATDPTGKKPRLKGEFDSRAFHKIGALGQGRDDNPDKASFLNQIYFVAGKKVTEQDLEALEIKKGIKFTPEQRKEYLKNGGLPRLDGDYTVFGEIYEGLEIINAISRFKTDKADYPTSPVKFSIQIIE
ncbi:peptidylprolyl isomerase [Sphingobacterium bovistauri]|uniref:peptidylprolyl isomerase n=1 Tax=Sphingobacterium bovistauri TaxID=2781959 RepID=A0ABS7Z895_9SPHI|nr:peptidylprolyl isomerase [Sphingobacterium bovistauri]MCA5006418.1 peptidylprolyl isomerase [Sphingobacterium bovistauri]